MIDQHTGLPITMQALASACDDVTSTILRSLDAPVAARLAGTVPYVVIRVTPLRAAVFAAGPDGEDIPIGEAVGAAVPRALDEAVWLFLGDTLADLPAPVAQHVAAGLRAGTGRLAVVISPFPFEAVAAFYDGGPDPIVLRRVTDGTRVH